MLKIDWQDSRSHVLINPKTPAVDLKGVERILLRDFPLPAHVWVTTSGSTGHLKWVALSKSAILASAHGVNRHLGASSRDVWVQALPEFHVGGIGVRARCELSGARLIDPFAEGRWSAPGFHRACLDTSATLASLVPAQLFDLVKLGLIAPRSLRALLIGGGALGEGLYREARALGWNPLPSYGATECCSTIAAAEPSARLDPLDPAGARALPKMRLLPHLEARSDPEDGRLSFRGPSLLSGYVLIATDGAADWSDPKRDDWFASEDLGDVTEGFVTVRGRRSDFIKIGGESVDLERLERLWAEIRTKYRPDFDLALIPVPDARLGHVIGAAIAADESSSRAIEARRLIREFNSAVLPFERVRQINFLPAIPRSPLGKLLRARLLDQIRRPRVQDAR